ncbi:hypothetical protein F0919_04590 [Taibaiella lutea]|uniref:Uncharacterized protein n=1 Tax=Taibaiella lutea TaxID=2608001 RepID=A0A5M6CPM3_9BACT|nr:hypothetical protein [Taibaiella lutea]KAA5536956.1 hypothetical protein F0919_04590 [Taibaiella lutea]
MNKRIGIAIVFLLLLNLTTKIYAQPELPNIAVITQGGINILSFTNPYESGIKSIAVERSNDSVLNFTNIGYVASVKKGAASFVDAHPMVGKNWYRLQIVFSSGMEWISNLGTIEVDSSAIANRKPLPPSDSLQKIINATGNTAVINEIKTVEMPKSQYVFTNPFTGNINIEIQDALKETYQLFFYDQNDKEVLRIPRINDKIVILDKRNFQTTGIFKFKLLKNKEDFDKGYVTIY